MLKNKSIKNVQNIMKFQEKWYKIRPENLKIFKTFRNDYQPCEVKINIIWAGLLSSYVL